ncbi:MAG: hypothetical protein QM756_14315 [Polyangiaceae bacterium]
MTGTALTFLPWVRRGATGLVKTVDPVVPATSADEIDARVELDVSIGLSGGSSSAGGVATTKLRLYGPGEVRGLDPKLVIRTEPPAGTPNFESNYFPFVEFDAPDLPWMFTPAAAQAGGRLRPWLCLVVVPTDSGTLSTDPTRPLPTLKVSDAGNQLPNLAESWAAAHAQVVGTDIAAALASKPERTLSRLLCFRRLMPRTSYIAAVVPAFDVGVRAGRGEKLDDTVIEKLAPAWTSATTDIELPVYFQWEFATGDGGDFESLVTALARVAGSEVEGFGGRSVMITNAGGGLPDVVDEASPPAAKPVLFPSALVPFGQAAPSYPQGLTQALAALVNASGAAGSLPSDLALPPPLYGRWHAAQSELPASASGGARDARWLRELNLAPHLREAAGAGARLVQEQQEELMASAWQQVGAVEAANQLLRQGQLARDAARLRYSSLAGLSDEELIVFAGPVLSRVPVDADAEQPRQLSALGRVGVSRVPLAAVSGALRRFGRPRGPLARRIARAGVGAGSTASRLLTRINDGALLAKPRANPSGLLTVKRALDALGISSPALCSVTPARLRLRERELSETRPLSTNEKALFAAFSAHQAGMPACAPLEPAPPKPKLDVRTVADAIRLATNPERSVPALIRARVRAPGWQPTDALQSILAAPSFPTPMFRSLAAVSQDYLLAGLDRLPANSITSVTTNPSFVAAFMAGLNHEMSRELLWREYPTDQRGSYFRQFWDPATRLPPPSTDAEREAARDIARVDEWLPELDLGGASANPLSAASAELVLVIRGELIQRYQRATIYVVQAEWYDAAPVGAGPLWRRRPIAQSPEQHERYPIFQGSLGADAAFIGFAVSPEAAIGRRVNAEGAPLDDDGNVVADPVADQRAGWFVVLQQQPTEPRFGLDESGVAGAARFAELGWTNVAIASNHLQVEAALLDVSASLAQAWPPANGADLAGMTLQRPYRAAIHLSDLLGTGEP